VSGSLLRGGTVTTRTGAGARAVREARHQTSSDTAPPCAGDMLRAAHGTTQGTGPPPATLEGTRGQAGRSPHLPRLSGAVRAPTHIRAPAPIRRTRQPHGPHTHARSSRASHAHGHHTPSVHTQSSRATHVRSSHARTHSCHTPYVRACSHHTPYARAVVTRLKRMRGHHAPYARTHLSHALRAHAVVTCLKRTRGHHVLQMRARSSRASHIYTHTQSSHRSHQVRSHVYT